MSNPGLRVDFRLDRAGAVQWLLIARNGRVIAMSPIGYADSDASVAMLGEVCADSDLVAQVTHLNSSVMWVWTAVRGSGDTVAVGGRPYARYGTCLSAGTRFLSVVRTLRGYDLASLAKSPICLK